MRCSQTRTECPTARTADNGRTELRADRVRCPLPSAASATRSTVSRAAQRLARQPSAQRSRRRRRARRRRRRSGRRVHARSARGRRSPGRGLGGARAALLPPRRRGVAGLRRRRLRALAGARRGAGDRRAGVPRRRHGVLRRRAAPRSAAAALETAAAWCALGRELAATSPKLAAIFFRTHRRRCCGEPDGLDAPAAVGRGRPRASTANTAGRASSSPRPTSPRRRTRSRRCIPRLSALGRRRRGALSGDQGARLLRPPAARRQALERRRAGALPAHGHRARRRRARRRRSPSTASCRHRSATLDRAGARGAAARAVARPASGWPAPRPTSRRSPARCCSRCRPAHALEALAAVERVAAALPGGGGRGAALAAARLRGGRAPRTCASGSPPACAWRATTATRRWRTSRSNRAPA